MYDEACEGVWVVHGLEFEVLFYYYKLVETDRRYRP